MKQAVSDPQTCVFQLWENKKWSPWVSPAGPSLLIACYYLINLLNFLKKFTPLGCLTMVSNQLKWELLSYICPCVGERENKHAIFCWFTETPEVWWSFVKGDGLITKFLVWCRATFWPCSGRWTNCRLVSRGKNWYFLNLWNVRIVCFLDSCVTTSAQL